MARARPARRVAGIGWKQFPVDFERKEEEMNETFFFFSSSEGEGLGFAFSSTSLESIFDPTASL